MTRSVTRILVPIDFSEPSDAALDYAMVLASRLGASLFLLHAFEDPLVSGGVFAAEMYAPMPEHLRESLLEDAKRRLGERLAKVESRFNPVAELYTGPPAKAILEFAKTQNIDLIVIGTHGRGGMAHLLLGSVAERVVRTAPCPVLTVRTATATVPEAPTAAVAVV
jgi:nucleotide-binding universal stress UspA family protein